MKTRDCKCYSCGNYLGLIEVNVTLRIAGKTMNGEHITAGAYPNDEMEIRAKCMCCGTEYLMSGYKNNLEKLVEW